MVCVDEYNTAKSASCRIFRGKPIEKKRISGSKEAGFAPTLNRPGENRYTFQTVWGDTHDFMTVFVLAFPIVHGLIGWSGGHLRPLPLRREDDEEVEA